MTVTYPTWVVCAEAIITMIFIGLLAIYYLLKIIEFFVDRKTNTFIVVPRKKRAKSVGEIIGYDIKKRDER